jgi:outer membrane protein assembly factor BamB
MRESRNVLAAVVASLALAAGAFAASGKREAGWTRWGGPDQEFRAPGEALAAAWPESGPRKVWARELGDGYSAILVEDGRLYTMYRLEGKERVVCLDAGTGKTIWEHAYASSPVEGHIHQFGDGPRSTPLIDGEAIYAVGVSGTLHALDKSSGKVRWSRELWSDLGGTVLEHGYASSPIDHGDTVIVLVGGEGHAIVALGKKDGKVRWQTGSFKNSYSSPRILDLAGRPQLVAFMADEVVGVDPEGGTLLWSHPHENEWDQNISMPIRVDERRVFVSSPQAGAKCLELSPEGDSFRVAEVWATRKIQFYHVNTVRDGDWLYGSTGTMAPTFMAALNLKTGEIAWRKRGYGKANCVAAGGRLVILDEDGVLYLTTASPADLELHARSELLSEVAWTVPTIVGRTLYVRDKTQILAVDLG